MGVLEGGGIVGVETAGMRELLAHLRGAADSTPLTTGGGVPGDGAPDVVAAMDDLARRLRIQTESLESDLSLLATFVDGVVDAFVDLDVRMVTGDADA